MVGFSSTCSSSHRTVGAFDAGRVGRILRACGPNGGGAFGARLCEPQRLRNGESAPCISQAVLTGAGLLRVENPRSVVWSIGPLPPPIGAPVSRTDGC